MFKKILIVFLVLVVITYTILPMHVSAFVKGLYEDLKDVTMDTNGMEPDMGQYDGDMYDGGMYDIPNPNAFGTTEEADRRITNDGVRKEYHHNPMPWEECGCQSQMMDRHGVPAPTPGQTHVCKYGFPSKRIVDMHGSHFQLNHICSPGSGTDCGNESPVLGRWWCRKGCSNVESAGLEVRPICTRCG